MKRMVVFALMLGLTVAVPAAQKAPVNVNQAGLAELDTLPGIGPALAQRIIDFREKNGPFRKVEDLMNVSGIGEKKFLQLKDLVTLDSPESPEDAEEAPTKTPTPS